MKSIGFPETLISIVPDTYNLDFLANRRIRLSGRFVENPGHVNYYHTPTDAVAPLYQRLCLDKRTGGGNRREKPYLKSTW
jgi:hypothetical protein